MKIVVLDGYTLNPGDNSWEEIEALGSLVVHDRTEPQDVVTRAKDATVVLTNKTPVSAEHIAQLPRLRLIAVLATGYNIVDIDAARGRQIAVCNVPEYGTDSVAQFTFALLLELCHRVGEHSRLVFDGQWSRSPDFCFWKFPLRELSGKTLGIVGYGRIGKRVAEIARAFGMHVVISTRTRPTGLPADIVYTSLDDLAKRSDVISLHCPLTDATRGMINREFIETMKQSALLLNVSRGSLINEGDLRDALNSGRIAGAALDVLSSEPPRSGNPLFEAKNCVITPHIAWAPLEARRRIMETTAENMKAFINGRPINLVY